MSSVSCPSCAAQLRVPAGAGPGKRFKCPKCGGVVTLPAAPAAWAPPSAVPQAPAGTYDRLAPAPYRPPAPPAPPVMAPAAPAVAAEYGGYDGGYGNPAPDLPDPNTYPSYQEPAADDPLAQLAASTAPAAPQYAGASGYGGGNAPPPPQGYAPEGYAPQGYAAQGYAPAPPPAYQPPGPPQRQPGYATPAAARHGRKKGTPSSVLIVAIIGGVVLLAGAGVGAYFLFGRGIDAKLTQDNFDQLKTGMTPAQVVDVMGKPTEQPAGMMNIKVDVWSNHKDKALVVWYMDDKVMGKQMLTGTAVTAGQLTPPDGMINHPTPAVTRGLFEGLTDGPAQPPPKAKPAPAAKPGRKRGS